MLGAREGDPPSVISASIATTCGDTSEGSTAARLDVASPKSPTGQRLSGLVGAEGVTLTFTVTLDIYHIIILAFSRFDIDWFLPIKMLVSLISLCKMDKVDMCTRASTICWNSLHASSSEMPSSTLCRTSSGKSQRTIRKYTLLSRSVSPQIPKENANQTLLGNREL